ncbi:transcriptional regulator, ArsR family [Ferrithrix thermotolerans DSM 19514]|uniref:Transcriptional regulator, ArsR family n=2 Tax=Ferrithrix TaxID=643949 RepID=A0A1M4Y9Q8_9ACTN|nr:transcriptional regulator, ArsR family [Ferrithrix thermotolerans DSM 19514]
MPDGPVGQAVTLGTHCRMLVKMTIATGAPNAPADGCCAPESRLAASDVSSFDEVDDEMLATMAKALGHPTRVKILRLLVERQACVTGDLVAELPFAQSTISEHLRILRQAGLIQGEIEGPRTSYCVDRGRLAALQRAVTSI